MLALVTLIAIFPGADSDVEGQKGKGDPALWTYIPVAVGVATTKSLAKVANRISKKSAKAKGVLVLTNEYHTGGAETHGGGRRVGHQGGVGDEAGERLALLHHPD